MAKLGSFSAAQRVVNEAEKPREPDTFEFEGEEFRVITSVPSLLPLMQFSAAMASADEDDDSLNMEALGAMYQMLRYCLDPRDWSRFERLAIKSGAGPEELLPITMAVWESVGARPTEGPSVSPGGPSKTSTSSKADSPSRKDRRSKRDRQTGGRSAPDVSDKVPANEWTPPPGRPDLAVPLMSVDEMIRRGMVA